MRMIPPAAGAFASVAPGVADAVVAGDMAAGAAGVAGDVGAAGFTAIGVDDELVLEDWQPVTHRAATANSNEQTVRFFMIFTWYMF